MEPPPSAGVELYSGRDQDGGGRDAPCPLASPRSGGALATCPLESDPVGARPPRRGGESRRARVRPGGTDGRVLVGSRRTADDRGGGTTVCGGLTTVLATRQQPRRRGRGVESEENGTLERDRLDPVLAELLVMAGISAVRWTVDRGDGA